MNAAVQIDSAGFRHYGMLSVVVDHQLVVKIKDRTIVGCKLKPVLTRFLNPELARVIDSKPFKTFGDAREPDSEVLRRYIQSCCVDRPARLQLLEIGKTNRVVMDAIDQSVKAGRDHNGRTERINFF